MAAENLDNKTLAILMVIADLMKEKHDPKHIIGMYERAVKQISEYQRS